MFYRMTSIGVCQCGGRDVSHSEQLICQLFAEHQRSTSVLSSSSEDATDLSRINNVSYLD